MGKTLANQTKIKTLERFSMVQDKIHFKATGNGRNILFNRKTKKIVFYILWTIMKEIMVRNIEYNKLRACWD